MLRLGAGELMPLILNEDDVHAWQPEENPCSGRERDSTNSPPRARRKPLGRAGLPPPLPGTHHGDPAPGEPRRSCPPNSDPARTKKRFRGLPPAPGTGGRWARDGGSLRTAQQKHPEWHFYCPLREGCFTHLWDAGAVRFPAGGLIPMPVSSVLRGWWCVWGHLPRVSMHWSRGGMDPHSFPAGSARSGALSGAAARAAEIEM